MSLGSNDETIIITQQLKMQFHSTRKEDLETIECYVMKLKSIADSLAANNNPLSDPDLVLQLLAGLPNSPQYLPYKNRISSLLPLPDYSRACYLLYMYESLLQEQQKENRTNNDDGPNSEDGNYNSTKEKFYKFFGVFNTVSDVVTTAWDVWNMFGTSSSSSTANTTGNKKYTKRRNRGRGRR